MYKQILLFLSSICLFLNAGAVKSDTAEYSYEDALEHFQTGNYSNAAYLGEASLEDEKDGESWTLLRIKALMTLGQYSDALTTLELALFQFPYSVRLRFQGQDVFHFNDEEAMARNALYEIERWMGYYPENYFDAESQVAWGRFLLYKGAEPGTVLEALYDRVEKAHPGKSLVPMAIGELALSKNDYRLAATAYKRALKLDKGNPDILFSLAKALGAGNSKHLKQYIAMALERNPNHPPSKLLLAERLIDAEAFSPAKEIIGDILSLNPYQPEAWAYRAVIAHLTGEGEKEKQYRMQALEFWPENPKVDYLIGKKLADNYRFSEAAKYQEKALALDDYLPAKLELAQNLLRLGDEEKGWKLTEEVSKQDEYNVVAYNLIELKKTLDAFTSLKADGFILRMEKREARIYGDSVMKLLSRAKEKLAARYNVNFEKPVVVEIFNEQKDFEIRTFGLPGGAGYLGVCFGPLITANSPAARVDYQFNWRATLWHELCHAITLGKTRNKMPRWLSEGISVYEEKEEDPRWGQDLTPEYREMILEGNLPPLSELSGAFLDASTPLDLEFAYFASSLAVEFIVEKFGFENLKLILSDLGEGIPINKTLATRAGTLRKIDFEFDEYARDQARKLAPKMDWESRGLKKGADTEALALFNRKNPDNWKGLSRYASELMNQKRWSDAKIPLLKLIELYPGSTGPGNPYTLLARAHRNLGEKEKEKEILEKLAESASDSVATYLRLIDIALDHEDTLSVELNALRILEVNPLMPLAQRRLARAAEKLGNLERSIQAYRAEIVLEPIDPADSYFRLSRLLFKTGELGEARLSALMALEEAPRFREAHRLLGKILSGLSKTLPTDERK